MTDPDLPGARQPRLDALIDADLLVPIRSSSGEAPDPNVIGVDAFRHGTDADGERFIAAFTAPDVLRELSHGVAEGALDIDLELVREHQDGPQAIGELMRQLRSPFRNLPHPGSSLHELGKISNVADEAESELFDAPRSPVAFSFEQRIELAKLLCLRRRLLQLHADPPGVRSIASPRRAIQ